VPRIGLTGHMSLPASTLQRVQVDVDRLLDQVAGAGLVGVTMLGGDADQLFAKAVLDRGGQLEVVVPATKYGDELEPARLRGPYNALLARASYIEALPNIESTEEAHLAGGQVVVDRSERLIAVWDGEPARGVGGTGDIVAYARQVGLPVDVVWPAGASRD
jgi:hypothetical protein